MTKPSAAIFCPVAPRYCGPHEYAARIAFEVVVLVTGVFALACAHWFQVQPSLLRAAIVTGLAYLSAASADTIHRLPATGRRAARGRCCVGTRTCWCPDNCSCLCPGCCCL